MANQETINNPMQKSSQAKCSYCGNPYELADARHRPFCSRRCQQVDMRNWLTESYGMPFEGQEEVPFEGYEKDDPTEA